MERAERCERCKWYEPHMKAPNVENAKPMPTGEGFCHGFPPSVVGTAFIMQTPGAQLIGAAPKPPKVEFAYRSVLSTTPATNYCRFFECAK